MLRNIRQFALAAIGANSIRQIPSAIAIKFKRGTFLRNVTIVASGNTIAQGILIVASPILTRLYSPSDFGIYAVFLAVVTILSIIFTLQYPLAIVLPKEERDAKVLFGMVIHITSVMLIISIAISIIIKLIGTALTGLNKLPWIILPIIAITSFVEAMVVILNCWNIRTKAFSLISKSVASAAITTVLFSTGMGLLAAGWIGLVLGALLGRIINVGMQLFYGNRLQILKDSLTLSNKKVLKQKLMKEHSDFPKYRLPQNLLNASSFQLPSILLVVFFGPTVGGLFALAKRILALPIQLVSESIKKVFYQKSVDLFHQGTGLLTASLKATFSLATVGFIPFASIMIFGPDLFAFAFGGDWRTAGVYAAWLTLEVYTRFCSVPSVSIIPVIGILRQHLIFEVISITSKILSLIIGAIARKALLAILLYSISGTTINILLIFFVTLKLIKKVDIAHA